MRDKIAEIIDYQILNPINPDEAAKQILTLIAEEAEGMPRLGDLEIGAMILKLFDGEDSLDEVQPHWSHTLVGRKCAEKMRQAFIDWLKRQCETSE